MIDRFSRAAKKLVQYLLAVASRGREFKYSIIISDSHLSWLNLDFNRLQLILKSRKIKVIRLSSILSLPSKQTRHRIGDRFNHRLALYPTLVELEECSENSVCDGNNTLSRWKEYVSDYYNLFMAGLERCKPKGVVIVHGYEPCNASLRGAAIASALPCIAIENSSRADRLIWDNVSAYACIDNLSRNFYFQFKDFVEEKIIREYREKFITEYIRIKSNEHLPGSPLESNIKKKVCSQSYLLFLAQVYTDAATINCLNDWASPLELLGNVADWCIANNVNLVIKLHPKELNGRDPVRGNHYNNLTLRKIHGNPSLSAKLKQHALLIDSKNTANTFDLIKFSGIVVTLTSQAGLEAAIFGKPVVVCGRSTYSGLGFTYDAPSPWLLEPQLRQAWDNKNKDHSFTASLYAYIYFEKYCIPKNEESLADLCVARFQK